MTGIPYMKTAGRVGPGAETGVHLYSDSNSKCGLRYECESKSLFRDPYLYII